MEVARSKPDFAALKNAKNPCAAGRSGDLIIFLVKNSSKKLLNAGHSLWHKGIAQLRLECKIFYRFKVQIAILCIAAIRCIAQPPETLMYTTTPDPEERVQLNIRVPRQLRDEFEAICRANDVTVSQSLREYIRDVVAAHSAAATDTRAK